MIELDVALSKDRQLLVIHDENLDRTTDGNGKVNNLTFSELKQLDAGSWFSEEFANERIPSLQEVLNLVDSQTTINIEIKKEYFDLIVKSDSIENQVLEGIKRNQIIDSVIVSSFEIKYLERLRKMDKDIRLAFITLEPFDYSSMEQINDLKLFSWHHWHETLSQQQVNWAHELGLKVFTFTVNTHEELEKVGSMGVDGVFSDNQPYFESQLNGLFKQ